MKRISLRLRLSANECTSCPPNASECDTSGRATKCSYGILTNGECIKKFCQRSTNIRGDECCTDGMAETCSDANTTLTCRKGWKLLKPSNDTVLVALDGFANGTLVDADRCQGPYAAHFGELPYILNFLGSKQQFVAPKDAPWNWKIGNQLSVEECALATLFPSSQNNDRVFLYERKNGYFNCRAFHRQEIKLEFKGSGGRYDFGTGGTCAEARVSWPFAAEYFDRVGCEDILVRETRQWDGSVRQVGVGWRSLDHSQAAPLPFAASQDPRGESRQSSLGRARTRRPLPPYSAGVERVHHRTMAPPRRSSSLGSKPNSQRLPATNFAAPSSSTRSASQRASTSTPNAPTTSTAAASSSKKRRNSSFSGSGGAKLDVADSLGLDGEALDFGSDEEGDDEDEFTGIADDEDEEDDDGDFPELDLEESEEDEDGDEDEQELDSDEEAILAELRAEDEDEGSSSQNTDDEDGSDFDALMKKYTSKPDEADRAAFETTWDEDELPVDYMKRSRTVKSRITGQDKTEWDDEIEADYASDSSTEETTNRIGNVPAYFYDEMPHIGYDIDGKKVMRPAQGDELDKFLEGVEDADGGWTTVKDKLHQQNVALTEEELDLIHRLAKGENPDSSYDPYADQIPYFSSQVMATPLTRRPEPKSRFLPSKWEHKKVMKIVRAIRSGRIVPRRPGAPSTSANKDDPAKRFYGLWSQTDAEAAPHPMHMPAPKMALPSHEESYNPPEEYLWTEEEKEEFLSKEKEDRRGQIIPVKHAALRQVGAYGNFVQERFDRCLDLYLAPRMLRRKPRLDIQDPSELIPKLPSPQELRPFPTTASVEYRHPNGVRIRSVSIDPTGMWVVTGAEDGEVRLWECAIGRCAMKWQCGDGGPIYDVEWCPDPERSIFAVASAHKVHLISPLPLLGEEVASRTKTYALAGFNAASTGEDGEKKKHVQPQEVRWSKPKGDSERDEGRLVVVDVPGTLKQVTWHKKGDYFATVAAPCEFGLLDSVVSGARSVLIHQLTKHQTQAPFTKMKGDVQCVSFHPSRPHFFVATQRHVRMYDLMKQALAKTLNPGVKWISSIDVHPQGDNVIVGSYDRRLVWHDLDLSSTPYKTLRYHARALRQVHFSRAYPLFLSTSDDGSIHVFHSTVYSDLLTNPLIVPLKVLNGHEPKESLGVLDAVWHPREPWIVSVGADGGAKLWCP
ncbi:BQ5605_C019g08880 [Microbotryum silenes-dioicae]|uniref:Ribosome biogenesis protein ERB1 n=1 Tax=Microbotryum silenes-dioicae TaxID=796604 RepID=A0A2X0LW35_9BASI|nr:BQ5605_C019g08880 [Microbotryum silenes-dioicae]